MAVALTLTQAAAGHLLLVLYLTVSLLSSGASAHKDAPVLLESLDALEKSSFRPDLEYKWANLPIQTI